MSRKHFEAIAAILKRNGAPEILRHELAQYFLTQNVNFDTHRFMIASGK